MAPSMPELVEAGRFSILNETAPSLVDTVEDNNNVAELDASKLCYRRTQHPRPIPAFDSPEVWSQNVCTDHMVHCVWNSKTGWGAPSLQPYGPLSLMPTASVLHYATECFEGLKAYRCTDGALRLFRPDLNCARMLSSATRIALPAFPPDELQKLIETLLAYDGPKWLPKGREGFLYIRPFMYASAAALGIQRPKEATLVIIAVMIPSYDGPMGSIGPQKFDMDRKPGLRLLASQENTVRAWPAGHGAAKLGANYGPSLVAQGEALARGYDQILWLFGDSAQVTEAGASNFFVIWKTKEGRRELITAPLDEGIILDGVTRRSILDLARDRLSTVDGLTAVERSFTMGEVLVASQEGRLLEAFASGTAYFVSSVSHIHFRGIDIEIPLGKGGNGPFTAKLKSWLQNIMYGHEQHSWTVEVDEA